MSDMYHDEEFTGGDEYERPKVFQKLPIPTCPDCKSPMRFKDGHGKKWESFWGCTKFPKCHGTREVRPDGKPETDYQRDERIAHKYDGMDAGDLQF